MWQHEQGRDALPPPPHLVHQCLKKVGQLFLPLLNYSTGENGPYTMPGKHSRAGPEGIGVVIWPCLLLTDVRGELA